MRGELSGEVPYDEEWEEGEDKALVLTLTGKAPVRPARPAAKPAEPPKAEAPKAVPAPEPAEDVPQSENPYHVKNTIEKCLFCGRCEHSCPMQAITIDRKTRQWTIDREKCVACGVCAENCPAKCLTMKSGRKARTKPSCSRSPERLRCVPSVRVHL